MKNLLITFLLVYANLFVCAQHIEIGLHGGSTYYIGELNPSAQVLNEPSLMFGLFFRKNVNKRYSYRFSAGYGKLKAADSFYDYEFSQYRNASFTSRLIEANGMLEFNFFPYELANYNTLPFTPYLAVGLNIFQIAPKTITSEEVFEDSPRLITSFPFAFGCKFNLMYNLGASFEWRMNKTFTDKIDGVLPSYSNGYQKSRTSNNDWYSYIGLALHYKILTKKDHCPVAR